MDQEKARYLNLSLIIATLIPGFVTCVFFPGVPEHGISILIFPLYIYLFAIYYALLFTYAFFPFILITLLVLVVTFRYLLKGIMKLQDLLLYGVWAYYLIRLYISTACSHKSESSVLLLVNNTSIFHAECMPVLWPTCEMEVRACWNIQ